MGEVRSLQAVQRALGEIGSVGEKRFEVFQEGKRLEMEAVDGLDLFLGGGDERYKQEVEQQGEEQKER